MAMKFDLTGKVALVTGAGGDIGRAIVKAYVGAGAKVMCADIDMAIAEASARDAGDGATAMRCDVADPASAAACIAATVTRFGALHILVNNAAGTTRMATVVELPLEEWKRELDVNLTGPFLMSKYALPEIIKAGGGSVIHIASQLGHVGQRGRCAYGSTKAALHNLTRIMALDHAKDRVRVNSISPGATMTSRLTKRWGSEAKVNEMLAPAHPIGRLGRPAEIGAAALYLASDESAFMTGADLLIDGGYTAQ
jgi:NAD(P)-dependent dehydrogenase (short-subunit alcohol dehydrogenase family)